MARLPSYRRHSSRNVAFSERLGKRKYFPGKHGSDESRRAYAKWIASLGLPADLPPDETTTVAGLIERFLDWARIEQSAKEYDHSRRVCKVLLETAGDVETAKFGPRLLMAVQAAFVGQHCRQVVNRYTQRVRRIFKWGTLHELVPGGVYHALQAVPAIREGQSGTTEAEPVEPVASDVVDATLEHLHQPVIDMVKVQQLTGMRPQSVCGLCPRDVDRAGDVWLYRPQTHKTKWRGRELVIPLGPRAQAILTPYMTGPEDEPCFRPRRRRGGVGQYTPDSYRREIVRAIERANRDRKPPLPMWSPNQLRHAAATEIRRRFGLEAAQVVLGHGSAQVTQIYAERNVGLAVQIAREIG